MNVNEPYQKLLERSKELSVIGSAGAILHWDMETKMPPRGVELKSQQLAWIQKVAHQMLTSPESGKIIDSIEKAKDYDSLDPVQKRNVYLSRKMYDEATKLPEDLVVEIAKQSTIGVNVWKKAKAEKNWKLFLPELQKIKKLKEKEAELLMEIKDAKTPYDALIDNFEPKMTAKNITRIFDEMKTGLKKVMDKVMSQDQPSIDFLSRHVSENIQEKIGESMTEFMLYDIKSENARVWLTKLNNDLPQWLSYIEKGSFKETKEWLTDNVYKYAYLYEPEELVEHVTGSKLVVQPFIDYLEDKFRKMYGY
jgi:carboxypeptidase Taq